MSFRGYPACDCLEEWLPWVEKLMLHRKIIKRNIDIFQLIGGASKSAGTHRTGGAFDIAQCTWSALEIMREAGADATWRRVPPAFVLHAHGVLRGCPHNSPARYQITAVDAGYNGLGKGGRGGRDDGPRPLKKRTWQEGIEWIKGQLGVSVVVPPPLVSTVWDHTHWNVASMKPGWFGVPWKDRQAAIGAVLKGADSSVITLNETHFSQQTKDILAALGPRYFHAAVSPVGNDILLQDVWKLDPAYTYKEYPLGAQARKAGVLHVIRKATGLKATIVNTHFPYGDANARRICANNLVELLEDVDGPIALAGDWNNEAFSSTTPHGILRKAGYEFMREQATITNGGEEEFPKKGQWLCDIATDEDRKNGKIVITGGALLLTSPKLSDHRPLKTRMHAA